MDDTAAVADTNGAGKGRGGEVNSACRSAPIPVVVDQSVDRAPDAEEEGEADHTGAGNGREDSRSDGGTVFEAFLNAESLEEGGRKLALDRLESMCVVLGVDFKKKMLEMDVVDDEDVDLNRIYEQIDYLQITIDKNFKKLKDIGSQLFMEWERSDTPFKTMIKFSYVISAIDSKTSDEISEPHFLDTMWLKKAQTELQNRKIDSKKEFHKQKEKLKEMIRENHLAYDNVGFNPQKKVIPENYYQETCQLRKQIDKIKELSVGRKEMVYRMELVRMAIDQNTLPVHKMRELLELASNHVNKINIEDEPIKYDGELVTNVLANFEKSIDLLEIQRVKQYEKELRMRKTRTRSGRSSSCDSSD